ncbi:hydroxyethylthiazole kinase, partial [Bacillus pumilus]|uniref:hydroxyethylthiazole kinase n=1 Tax=Bacillus pumilus TaxID=1408 RepID=UPI001C92CEEC
MEKVGRENGVVDNMRNEVVRKFRGNGVVGLGGWGVMGNGKEEVGEMGELGDGVVVNIGTLSK